MLLLIIFRSPIIAFLPLITIAIVSQVATGLISDINKALNLNADASISTILIVVLFGIGTDYILFLLFRYRERLRAGEDFKQAMNSAVSRVGEVISSAAGVVIFAPCLPQPQWWPTAGAITPAMGHRWRRPPAGSADLNAGD